MDIDTMPAGHEMDALMAKRVMGWHVDGINWFDPNGKRHGYIEDVVYYEEAWSPSTDIAAAWTIAEEMIKRGFGLILYTPGTHYANAQGAKLRNKYCATFQCSDLWHSAWSETAPLAVCRAALKIMEAVGEL